MSVHVMALVWESSVPSPERLTLLALADRADEEGVCWPSIPTLARKCCTGESTIRRHLKALATLGVVTSSQRWNASSLYRIDLARLRELATPRQPATPRQSDTPCQIDTPSQSDRGANLTPPPNLSGPPSQIGTPPPPRLSGPPSQSERLSVIDPSVDTSVIRQGSRARARTSRGTRIPDDFAVTPDMVAWAREYAPHVDGRRETDRFLDHWRAASGANATKRDWPAAWRNWLRKADDQLGRPAPGRASAAGRVPTTTARVAGALAFLDPNGD